MKQNKVKLYNNNRFITLIDTPSGYVGDELKALRVNAAGDAIEFFTISAGSGIVETLVGGTDITIDSTDPANPIVNWTGTHNAYTGSNGITLVGSDFQHSDTSAVADFSPFPNTFIDSMSFDGFGHVTAYSTDTLPSEKYVYNSSFNTSTGDLTLVVANSSDVVQSLDGRYSLLGHTHVVADITDFTDNSTNWNTAYSNMISSLTTSGTSGAATLVGGVLNIPIYGGAGAGGQVDSVVGGTDITVDNTDPVNPIVNFTGTYFTPTSLLVDYSFTDNSTNWNTAFSWGDHSLAGYLTSFTETDPVFTASPAAGILVGDINNWDIAFGWGDHDGLYLPIGTQLAQTKAVVAGEYFTSYDSVTGLFTSATPPNDNDNFYLTGLAFNTGNGILTATVSGATNQTVDLDGRYLQSESNAFGTVNVPADSGFTWGASDVVADNASDTLKIVGGTDIIVETDATNDAIRIRYSGSAGASTFLNLSDTPVSYVGQGLKGVRVNSAADALEFYTTTDANDNDFVDGASFNTGNGILTLSVSTQPDVTVDLDSRWSLIGHTHTLSEVTDVSATAAELNVLDLSATSLTTGWVYAANGVSTASWRKLLGSEITNNLGWTTNVGTVTSVTGSGSASGITLTQSGTASAPILTLGGSASINNSNWSGLDLVVSNGGTGASSLTGVVIGNGTSSMTAITGTASQLLRRNAGNTAYEFFTPTYVTSVTASGSLSSSGGTTPNITHLTTAGNKHIPTGGATNQYLKYSASGTASWSTILGSTITNDSGWTTNVGTVTSVGTSNSTFISGSGGPITGSGSLSFSLSATGTPSATTFLRGDNTWATPVGGGYTGWTIQSGLDGATSAFVQDTHSVHFKNGTFVGTNLSDTTGPNYVMDIDLTASGTPSASTYLRGDNTWATIPSGSGTVTSVTAGAGMTQTGVSTINPTLNVIGGAGGVSSNDGGILVSADKIGINYTESTRNLIITAAQVDGPVSGDFILYHDISDGVVKRANVASLPFGIGSMSNFTVSGNSGTNQSITQGNTLSILGTGVISTTASATDTITISAALGTLSTGTGLTGASYNGTTSPASWAIDYLGTDNFLYSAPTLASPSGSDYILYHDVTDNNVKKALISSLPSASGGGANPYAHYIVSTSQNVGGANGTSTSIDFDGTPIATDAEFVKTSSRIEVQTGGRYEIKWMIGADQTGSARTTLMSSLLINGSTPSLRGRQRNYSRGSGYGDMSLGMVTELDLSSKDYIEAVITVDDTDGAYTINSIPAECEFIIRQLA